MEQRYATTPDQLPQFDTDGLRERYLVDEVFVPGEVIDTEQALAPCRDPDGGLKAVGNFRCADGRRLFQVDANTGARAGWGFGGTAYRETADAASDRDYAAAYRACTA